MFNALPMLQNTITATADAMSILAADAQAFQTDGYKQNRYTFSSVFNQELTGMGGRSNRNGGVRSTQGLSQGITLIPMGYDMSQGGIKAAGQYNAAISGQGFFILQNENSNQQLLTRASDFIFAADGTLVDVFGRKLKGYKVTNGVADKSAMVDIKLDPETYNLTDVGFEDGGILTSNYTARQAAMNSGTDEPIPEGEETFQLALAYVPNASQMDQSAGNTFKTNLKSGSVSYYGVADEQAFGSVIGASSESSNVNPAETTIVGIQLQRAYNATQGALTMTNKFLTQIMDIAGK